MRLLISLAALLCCAAPIFAQETVADALTEMDKAVPSIDQVEQTFEQLYATACPKYEGAPSEEPQSFDIRFRYESDDATQPDRLLTLYQFFCYAGAYNAAYVFFTWDGIDGLKPLGLPQPQVDVAYEGGEFDDRNVNSIAITGYTARPFITNASYDAATMTIHSESYWRGMGDASHSANWVFDEGEFILREFYVDASYDEEINPKAVVDFRKPQLVK